MDKIKLDFGLCEFTFILLIVLFTNYDGNSYDLYDCIVGYLRK